MPYYRDTWISLISAFAAGNAASPSAAHSAIDPSRTKVFVRVAVMGS